MEHQSDRPVDWIEDAVNRHGDKLFRTALAILQHPADAEDIVQDTIIKLVEKHPDFVSPEHESAWLVRVTVNLCKNRLNSHWHKVTVPLPDVFPTQNDDERRVVESILALPVKYRTVIHLRYIEGYSIQEIAEMTNQTEAAVRKQHTRARKLLGSIIEEERE